MVLKIYGVKDIWCGGASRSRCGAFFSSFTSSKFVSIRVGKVIRRGSASDGLGNSIWPQILNK